ncbi:MAG: (deoxy)nucleoside triphosphate pyrophosphohydrolase [Acidobacteria bacterium]|nr:MAG: (deoxy)nucleoside triphosphate pyrophosphohydrolase [Acidobacteriota bacterium]
MSSADAPRQRIAVVGAAIVQGDRCLAAQRSAQMPLPLQWEFHGGKVELGEDPRAALRRELREELGVDVEVGELLGTGSARQGEVEIVLDVYLARLVGGELHPREHARVGWFTAEELRGLEWAEADVPAVERVCGMLEGERRERPSDPSTA